jgi:hypothetical protein
MNPTIMSVSKATLTRRNNKRRQNGIASLGSLVMGGIAPITSFEVSHFQAPDLTKVNLDASSFLWIVTLGLLVYSAPLVISWFSRYVGMVKAVGFVVAMETTQTFTSLSTAVPALMVLVVLNAIILRGRFLND